MVCLTIVLLSILYPILSQLPAVPYPATDPTLHWADDLFSLRLYLLYLCTLCTNTASAREISPPAQRASASHPRSHSYRRYRRHNQPLDQHINKPLRRHVWASTHRAWTRAALARERTAFFDTRETGLPEVWQTLRAALLWDPVGQGAADDGTNRLATAQGFLSAAKVTLPTGDLAQGAYDALGNYYLIPEWVVADPENVVEEDTDCDGDEVDGRVRRGDRIDGLTGGEEDTEAGDKEEVVRRREENGKGVADMRDLITVHARLSENSQDVNVLVCKSDTVRSLARNVQEESRLPATKKVRIAYMGKILEENAALPDQGWKKATL